jgi:pyruvate carboxylase
MLDVLHDVALCRDQYTLEYYLDLAEKLVDHGIHTLAIKDMAGVLRFAPRHT